MKAIIRAVLGAVSVCLVLAIVINQSGLGQSSSTTGGINAVCPALQTDELGAPLNPPYSLYINPAPATPSSAASPDNNTIVLQNVLEFKTNLPCCATITYKSEQVGTNPITGEAQFAIVQTVTPTAANGQVASPGFDGSCFAPSFNVSDQTITDPLTGLPTYPTFPHFCPGPVTVNVTMEAANGAVQNCIPPLALPPAIGGGSDFTGGNAQ